MINMDQKKIGKFISEKRKELKLTQAQLAEKLGVTDKTVSRWENGNYMPDLSLLQQLSKELNVSINELLSGEKVSKEDYQQKFEENIISTIDYSNKKLDSVKTIIAVISTIFSIIVLLAFNLITVFANLACGPHGRKWTQSRHPATGSENQSQNSTRNRRRPVSVNRWNVLRRFLRRLWTRQRLRPQRRQ